MSKTKPLLCNAICHTLADKGANNKMVLMKIIYLGHLRDLAGQSSYTLDMQICTPDINMQKIITHITRNNNELKKALCSDFIRVVLDNKVIGKMNETADIDIAPHLPKDQTDWQTVELAFLPPFSGG